MVNSGADIQVDRGEYTRIHNAILENLAGYDFTSREYACLLFLLRMTYGFNRKEHKLSYGDFRDATGIDPAHVSRAMKRLVDHNVVFKSDARTKTAATWSFNKYFEQWTIPSRIKTPKANDANYCSFGNSLDIESIAETAKELLPKEQKTIAETAIDDCQKSNSLLWSKDNIKDNSKNGKDNAPVFDSPVEQSEKVQSTAPISNGYFGKPKPMRPERVTADGYTQDAAKLGVSAAAYVKLFNTLIDIAGWRALVNANDDSKLNYAKRDALTLIVLGYSEPDQVRELADAYMEANKNWRNKPPQPKDLAEYASQKQAGVLVEPTKERPGANREIHSVKFAKPGDDIYA